MNEQIPENVQSIIDSFHDKLYIMENEMEDVKHYRNLIDEVFDHLRAGFEIKSLRECPVYFKFHKDDTIIHTLQLRHFLTNLIFWEPLIELDSVEYLNEKFIVECHKISSSYIKTYIDNNIIIPYRNKIKNKKMNKLIHDLIFNLTKISTEFNIILGLSISVESFIDVANKNERFNEIIRTKLDPNMQPSEIESHLHDLMKEEIQILMKEDNVLRPMLLSQSGIKDKQLSEFSINMGLKPSLEGSTIPIPINSNLLVGGLSTVSGYYIDALGGRKSLIFNKNVMGKSGYFARKSMLLVSDMKLRQDEKTCRSVHPLQLEVKTKEHFRRLIGRMYRLPNQRNYSILTNDDIHVIGKKIYVKSPITCASSKGVCKDCYGPLLFHTNQGGVGIGSFAGAIITNPLSQAVLSSKHLLTTTSEPIEFNEDFNKYFNLNANEVTIKISDDYFIDDYSLLLIDQNIITLDELNEGEINKFCVIYHVKNNRTNEIYEIKENTGKEMYLSPELIEMIEKKKKNKDGIYEIKFIDIPDDQRLFLLQIENGELTRPLYKIMVLTIVVPIHSNMYIKLF